MNCDLWRSRARIIVHWSCLLFTVGLLVGRNSVAGICTLKPKKKLFKNFKKPKKPTLFC